MNEDRQIVPIIEMTESGTPFERPMTNRERETGVVHHASLCPCGSGARTAHCHGPASAAARKAKAKAARKARRRNRSSR